MRDGRINPRALCCAALRRAVLDRVAPDAREGRAKLRWTTNSVANTCARGGGVLDERGEVGKPAA